MKTIYDDYKGVYKIKKNALVKASTHSKKLNLNKLFTLKTKASSDKISNLIEKRQSSRASQKDLLPIHPKQPLNIYRIPSPREGEQGTSQPFNIFETN